MDMYLDVTLTQVHIYTMSGRHGCLTSCRHTLDSSLTALLSLHSNRRCERPLLATVEVNDLFFLFNFICFIARVPYHRLESPPEETDKSKHSSTKSICPSFPSLLMFRDEITAASDCHRDLMIYRHRGYSTFGCCLFLSLSLSPSYLFYSDMSVCVCASRSFAVTALSVAVDSSAPEIGVCVSNCVFGWLAILPLACPAPGLDPNRSSQTRKSPLHSWACTYLFYGVHRPCPSSLVSLLLLRFLHKITQIQKTKPSKTQCTGVDPETQDIFVILYNNFSGTV